MTNTPPLAAAATILLHAALLAAVVSSLAVDPEPKTESVPLKVQLIAPAPTPSPVVQPAPPQPAALPAPPKKERAARKPQAALGPTPSAKTAVPVSAPETSSDSKPQIPAAAPAPPSTTQAAPPPAAPVAPARTSASEASYASTNRVPPYPRLSASNGEEGTVILRVLVTTEGIAGAVEIRSSSGYPLLDESARKTVQTWRFRPATVDGKPVAEWYQVPIPFKLQNN